MPAEHLNRAEILKTCHEFSDFTLDSRRDFPGENVRNYSLASILPLIAPHSRSIADPNPFHPLPLPRFPRHFLTDPDFVLAVNNSERGRSRDPRIMGANELWSKER